jgi:hypothetical protein
MQNLATLPAAAPEGLTSVMTFSPRLAAGWILLGLLAVAVLRISSTYPVLNNTVDELNHIAAGMEWLDHGTYKYETMHPPMRAVYAIGPRLLGRHYTGATGITAEGQRIVYGDGHYWRNLTVARVAALPFFALTLVLVFVWARRLAGPLAAIFAALAYSTLPLALAHAGVAATDTLGTATVTLALFAWTCWLEKPVLRQALLCGLAIGLALISKMSAILFLGVVIPVTGALWLLRIPAAAGTMAPPAFKLRLRRAVAAAAVAAVAVVLVLWAGYRFSLQPILPPADRPHEHLDSVVGASGLLHDLAYRIVETPIPAVDFLRGLVSLQQRNGTALPSFFLGDLNIHGNPLYFPIAILVKTPIPFLLLATIGAALLLRRAWRNHSPMALLPPLASLLILLQVLPSRLNIGLRHILPIFPLLAVGIGVASAALCTVPAIRSRHWGTTARAVLIVLFCWQIYAGIRIHPDYLAYFNECCTESPQQWLLESDLDWGQDLARLSNELKARGIDQLNIAYFGTADLDQHGLPPHSQLPPYQHVSGWIAISEFRLALGTWEPPYDQYRWLLDFQPETRIGKSIRLYRIP